MQNAARIRKPASLAHYSVLLARVRDTFVVGQRKIDELKVQTYWEAGQLIHEHLRHHSEEAGYGKEVMGKLARSLNIGDDLLYRVLRFYQAFPIFARGRNLNWSHYRTLSRIPDKKRRLELEERAARENWDAEKLRKHISFITSIPPATNADPSAPLISLLQPKRGRPCIYRIVADGDGCAVDLGFTSYLSLNSRNRRGDEAHTAQSTTGISKPQPAFKLGEIVRISSSGKPAPAPNAIEGDLYTYHADILRVVDGDTLWLKIWLTPLLWLKERIRLRGIDCPELNTPEGKAAKQFVEAQVHQAASVTIATTKPDKWDRYLSDIFLTTKTSGGPAACPSKTEEVFLNNLLLQNGHARRYDKVTLADWEEK